MRMTIGLFPGRGKIPRIIKRGPMVARENEIEFLALQSSLLLEHQSERLSSLESFSYFSHLASPFILTHDRVPGLTGATHPSISNLYTQ